MVVDINDGSKYINSYYGTDTFKNINGIVGGSGDDTLIGNSGRNTLIGGSGNDTLLGYGGDDYIDGGKFGFLTRETCTDNGGHSWGNGMLGSSIAQGTSTANDQCFSKYWNANYELIKRCNALLENVDEISMSDDKKEIGRAHV